MTIPMAGKEKSRSTAPAMFKAAIVGAATLRGKELKQVLEERNFPAADILLLDDDESLGQLDSVGEEITFIQAVTRASFDGVDLVFFASDEGFTRKHWKAAQQAGCAIVDMSRAIAEDAGVLVRSPWLERELEPQMEKAKAVDLEATLAAVAHPAATMLALLLLRAQRTGAVRQSVVTLFHPVSERGKGGMDELHQQTLNLLSFQPMPKKVFDEQVAFNLVSQYGAEAPVALQSAEAIVLADMKQISRSRVEMPALQVLQPPVFHGHSAAIFLQLDRHVRGEDFTLALQGEHVTITGADEAPSNVNVAGQESIQVAVRTDVSQANGLWLWAAADNLKIAALNAVECASSLMAARPSGKIQ